MAYTPDFLSRTKGQPTFPVSVPANSSSIGTATHAAVTLTVTASAGRPITILEVDWSYSGGTVTGGLTIKDGSTSIFDIDITATGPGSKVFALPRAITAGNNLVVTLADGGASVVGKLNIGAFVEL